MTVIVSKNTTVTTRTPPLGSLAQGELAVNITDQKLWVGNSLGNGVILVDPQSSSGEINTASTPSATGEPLTMAKDGVDLPFKALIAGAGITLTPDEDSITIVSTASGGGEVNTTSNLGPGVGLAAPKVGVDLPFKSLIAGNNITFNNSTDTVTINASIPGPIIGEIRMYNDTIGGGLPFGWYICDGSNGTPDYTGRVLFSAGTGFTDNARGGALPTTGTSGAGGSHTHSVGIQTQYSNQSNDGGGDHKHFMDKINCQAGSGAVAAAWLDNQTQVMSSQGSDHSHPVIGNTGSVSTHTHTTPAPTLPPYAVITGYIIYLGV